MKPTIAILGAGPAGLGLAARLLARADLAASVLIVERNPEVGGLAGSFEHSGLYLDHGSHRLHPATAPEILADLRALLGAELEQRLRNGRIRMLERYVAFPFNPLNLARTIPPWFTLGVLRDAVTRRRRRDAGAGATFADVLLAGLGPTICSHFYFPYAQKLWGLPPEQIAAVQARRRVAAGTPGKLARKALGAIPGLRPPRTGYYYYPRQGFGQLSRALAADVERRGGRILLSCPLAGLRCEKGRVSALVLGGVQRGGSAAAPESVPVDFVFSTVPISVLARSLRPPPPAQVAEAADGLHHQGMILVYLILECARFTPYDAHYFPGAEAIFSRVSEPKNYSLNPEPAGLTGLCAEIPCAPAGALWQATDEELGARVLADLARVDLSVRCPVRAAFTRRLPHVYPVYDRDYEARLRVLETYLGGIDGLVTLGRQGLFVHDNTHHTMEMAYRAADCLGPGLAWDAAAWRAQRERFATHVVED